ncbi:MAG: hypothetical protein WDA71_10780 [Actinomycetota bacterium]
MNDSIPGNLTDPVHLSYLLSWDAEHLVTDPARVFQANTFHPEPDALALADHSIGVAIPVVPVWWLTRNPITTYNAAYLLGLILSGLGAFLLIRDLTGDARAGILAGIVFGFAPYRLAHETHLHIVSVQWIPFALLYLHRFRHRPSWRNASAFGAFVGLQALVGGHAALFMALAGGTVGLVLIVSGLRSGDLRVRSLLRLALPLAAAGTLVVSTYLPYQRVYQRHPQFRRPLTETALYSPGVRGYLAAPAGNWLYGGLTAGVRSKLTYPWEKTLFPGVLPVLLAGAGIAYGLRRRSRRGGSVGGGSHAGSTRENVFAYSLLAVIAGVLTLGPVSTGGRFPEGGSLAGHHHLPFYYASKVFPPLTAIRVPGRFFVVVLLALAVLSGVGVAHLLRDIAARRKGVGRGRIVFTGFLPLLLTAGLLAESVTPVPVVAVPARPAVYDWVRTLPKDAVLLELPTAFATKPGGPIAGWSVEHEPLYMMYSTYHWRRLVNGYGSNYPASYLDLVAALADFPSPETSKLLKDRYGVSYLIVHLREIDHTPWTNIMERIGEAGEWARVYFDGDAAVYRVT